MRLKSFLEDDRWGPGAVLAAGLTLAALVVVAVVLFIASTGPTEINVAGVTTTTVADADGQAGGDTADEHEGELPESGIPDHLHGEDPLATYEGHDEEAVPDYADKVIPPDQYQVVFNTDNSGLDPALQKLASDQAAALVRAQITGEGRDLFPTYFTSGPDPALPYATNFKVQFTTASSVPAHPDLVRTVVLWEGTGSGNVPFLQVRIANYFAKNADGTLTPVRNDFLPKDLANSDGLLSGVSIIG